MYLMGASIDISIDISVDMSVDMSIEAPHKIHDPLFLIWVSKCGLRSISFIQLFDNGDAVYCYVQ